MKFHRNILHTFDFVTLNLFRKFILPTKIERREFVAGRIHSGFLELFAL